MGTARFRANSTVVPPFTGFVGRKAELDSLVTAAGHARDGSGRFIIVSGEPGIGKTRLCDELTGRARGLGLSVAWVACWEDAALGPLWSVTELLSQLGVTVDQPHGGDEPEVARAALFSTVVDAVREASRRRPVLLIVDDVHWADADTRRLLTYLAPVVRTMPVLVVAAARDDAKGRTVVNDLRRHAAVLHLNGLGVAEVSALAETLVGDVSPALVESLHRSTNGNPLFASELLIHARGGNDPGALRAADALPLTPTVRAVLDERLAELGDDARRVLTVGAIVGAVFDTAILAAVIEDKPDLVLVAVEQAERAGVVTDEGIGRYGFAHPLFRSVLIDDVGVAQRMALHRRIGEALEDAGLGGGEVNVSALAFHYLAAAPSGTGGKAVVYAERAARAAFEGLAYERAAELYGQALAANQLEPGHADRLELLLGAGQARIAAADRAGGRRALLEAAGLARAAGRARELAAAALGLAGAGFEVQLFDQDQVRLLEAAYGQVADTDGSLRARLAARLSVALSLTEDVDERRAALAEEAVQRATSCGDDAALAHALAARCDVLSGPDHVNGRSSDAQRIVRLARQRRDLGVELVGRRLAVVAAFEAGDMPALDAEVAAFAEVADALGQPQYRWYVELWRGARAIMRGRVGDYATAIAAAETLGAEAESVNCEILTMPQRWFASLELGDPAAALAVADERAPFGRWAEMGPQMLPLDVGRRVIAGRLDEARAVLETGMPVLRAAARDAEWLTMVAQVGVLAAQIGANDDLPWMYEFLLPFADLWSLDGIGAYSHGPVHRQLGVLAAALGRADDARAHFDTARRGSQAAGADLLVARTLLDCGRALHDEASLGEARSRYTTLGVEHRVAEIDALLGHPPGPAAPEPARFQRVGDIWEIAFAGVVMNLRDSKGMRDLAQLLAHPGREVPAVDLVAPGGTLTNGTTGTLIDRQARDAYKLRLIELDNELDDADAIADTERSARLTAERDALLDQLSGAYGIGGRPRRSGEPSERARTAVTARIRDTIRRIERDHPALGRHLRNSVRTGTFCSYNPEQSVSWQL